MAKILPIPVFQYPGPAIAASACRFSELLAESTTYRDSFANTSYFRNALMEAGLTLSQSIRLCQSCCMTLSLLGNGLEGTRPGVALPGFSIGSPERTGSIDSSFSVATKADLTFAVNAFVKVEQMIDEGLWPAVNSNNSLLLYFLPNISCIVKLKPRL